MCFCFSLMFFPDLVLDLKKNKRIEIGPKFCKQCAEEDEREREPETVNADIIRDVMNKLYIFGT